MSTDITRLAEAIDNHGKAVKEGCDSIAQAISEGFHELLEVLAPWNERTGKNDTLTDGLSEIASAVKRAAITLEIETGLGPEWEYSDEAEGNEDEP